MRSQMNLLRATQYSSVLLLCLLCGKGGLSAQPRPSRYLDIAPAAATVSTAIDGAVRAYPSLHLSLDLDLAYVGMVSPDAVFRTNSKIAIPNGTAPGEGIAPATPLHAYRGVSEAPEWMLLCNERVVEMPEEPAHAVAAFHVSSRPAMLRNRFLTYAYGRPSVIAAPKYVVTDSRHRVVVSDPSAASVHVLDPQDKTSFRLVAGKGYRVHEPAGVAVDADDNLYVADSDGGMVVVFDANGNFLRYLGDYKGEPEFLSPRGIAIDQRNQHLFVVDTPASRVIELDLAGHFIKQLGRARSGSGDRQFEWPTQIAVNHENIFVLDRWGTRVQVLDLNLNPVGSFELTDSSNPEHFPENGMGTDEQGRVYVSLSSNSVIQIYTSDGKQLSSFGQTGIRVGQFAGPGGLWIDSDNRLYVADSGNGRVQMFQLKPHP